MKKYPGMLKLIISEQVNLTSNFFKLRRIKWENNLKIIAKHNKEADTGKHTFWLGMNAYGDMVISSKYL